MKNLMSTPGVAQVVNLLALVMVLTLSGCRSAKPAAPKPRERETAEHSARQATGLMKQRNWHAAAGEWRRAADRYLLLNDRTNAAMALHNLGQAEAQMEQWREAADHLQDAAQMNEAIGNTPQWWLNQLALLQLSAQSGRTPEVGARMEKLQPLAEQLTDVRTRALFLNELGLYNIQQGKYAQAADSFGQAGELFAKAGDRLGSLAVQGNEARLYEAQGNFPAAVDGWYAVLAGFESLSNPPGIAAALAGLGRAFLAARQDLPAAEDFLRRAAHNYRVLGQRTDLRATLALLVEALNQQGKTGEKDAIVTELRALTPVQAVGTAEGK